MIKNNHPKADYIKNKKIFFWCCKSLGLKSLKYLLTTVIPNYSELEIVGISISTKDKSASAIRELANQHDIPIYEDQNYPTVTADLGLCIGFPHKLPLSVIEQCANGVVNLHFAPLPHYRGSGTLTHAIVNQETRYGLTLHYMDAKLDTGPIIAVEWLDLPLNATVISMTSELESVGYTFFTTWIEKLLRNDLDVTSQNDISNFTKVTSQFCTKKSVEQLYELSKDWSEEKIDRYLRALTTGKTKKPYFVINNKKVFLSFTE